MSKLADVLRPFWLPGLNEVDQGQRLSFKGWLAGEQYVINGTKGPSELEIYFADPKALLGSVALDIDRFSAVALETLAGVGSVGTEFASSRAWSLIKAYYSAFFAAHGFCRIFGHNISHLDRTCADALRNTLAKSHVSSSSINIYQRNYLFNIDAVHRSISAMPLNAGSHEEMWSVFAALLGRLEAQVLHGTAPTELKQETFVCLSSIRDIINHEHSSGNWLSKIRNNLNYRHDYGAWFPHGDGRHWNEVDGLFRMFLHEPLSHASSSDSKIIVRFTRGCALIVGLYFDLIRDLARRHPQNKSFLAARTGSIYFQLKGKTLSL